tara:strand:+ start:348 stop:887 length:540 start_codon:yes stop_codon:yes gene_type:complete
MNDLLNNAMSPVRNTSRYSRGKIYKIVNTLDDKIYIGSTCVTLCKRLYSHKNSSIKNPLPCHNHFIKIGWENTRIILIEDVIAVTRDQLLQREQFYLDQLKPELNKPNDSIVHYNKCKHKVSTSQCLICTTCEHNKFKPQCKDCNKNTHYCKDCNKSYCSAYVLKTHMKSKKHIKNQTE